MVSPRQASAALREWRERRAARRSAETVVDLIESSEDFCRLYGASLAPVADDAMRWAKAREYELRTRALGAAMESGDYGDWLLDEDLYGESLLTTEAGPYSWRDPVFSEGRVIRGPEGFEDARIAAGRYAADLTDPVANAQAAARYLHERYGQVRPDGIRDPRLWD